MWYTLWWKVVLFFLVVQNWLHAWKREGYAKLAENLAMTTRKNCNSLVSFRRSKWLKKLLNFFRNARWTKLVVRPPSKSFWQDWDFGIASHWACKISPLESGGWNHHGKWTISNVPDFTALDNHLKLVQVGTQTVFEQIPVELAEQGVVFTDFHSALEEFQNS